MSSGVRWADTTRISCATVSSPSTSAACRMTGRSLSEPITMPTIGSGIALHPVRGEPGASARGVRGVRADGDVAELPARPGRLAVEVDAGLAHGETGGEPGGRVRAVLGPDDVDHRGGRDHRGRIAQREVEHSAEMLLE